MRAATYDTIGQTYGATRRADPRIASAIHRALGNAESVVNIGAGTGTYEPGDRPVIAVEPSSTMIAQRTNAGGPVVRAVAEALPFRSDAFDAALAVLTVHHWSDWRAGIAEMRRVARCTAVFTFDTEALADFWLTSVYFPEILELDRRRGPSVAEVAAELGTCQIEQVAIPHDCADGFLAAFWRRPERYLDPVVRAGISAFAQLDQRVVESGVRQLAADLESGAWQERFGHLISLDSLDVGYRLLTSDSRQKVQRV